MTRPCSLFLLPLLFTLPHSPVLACDRGSVSLEVLVDGRPLSEYTARGTTYVEASRGGEYSLKVSNRTGGRIAVAVSVDGLNVIDAKTTSASDARKWVLDPWETIVLDGWQISGEKARRFFFTSEDRSYGAWLGKTANLGVIAAVAYREKARPAIDCRRDAWNEPTTAPRSASAPEGGMEKSAAARSKDSLAATGIGREVDHRVVRVEFEPDPDPIAKLELRYEYHDALVRLGVLHSDRDDDALARRERARGFDGMEFAPDPYSRH